MGVEYLTGMTAESFEKLLRRWREEYAEILLRRDAASETEVRQAFAIRGRRMKGEFLLAELARRGFTPSYGFPVDVVTFDHLSGHDRDLGSETVAFGDRRGGASRTLDVAIREYAPGAEIVIDGLVHRSEGVLPAWRAMADASKLEDLQYFWECPSCRVFGLARMVPEACPECFRPKPGWKRSLKPAGFLGRRAPHTGYENLGHAPYELPRISASKGTWKSLPNPATGRYRADSAGQIVTLSAGPHASGYALCLDCGRAQAETEDGVGAPIPRGIVQHFPLARAPGMTLKGGNCPGGFVRRERIQRNVRLIHAAQTDVFELQLPAETTNGVGLALAAGLREALAERLGTDVREIGVSVGVSKGRANENRISAFLYDRAAGGAGLSSRLAESEWFDVCLKRARERLSCAEACSHGCPACVLRPDLNFGGERLDRPAAMALAETLHGSLEIPKHLQVFGPNTKLVHDTLSEWIDQKSRTRDVFSATFYLHGAPSEWELAAWPIDDLCRRLKAVGTKVEVVLEHRALTDKGLTIGQKLDLHRLSAYVSLGLATNLPSANHAPVVLSIEDVNGTSAVATSSAREAIPGPHWGMGEEAPLVQGQMNELPETSGVSAKQLVKLSGGNAQLIRLGARLDGQVTSFGRSFWKLLDGADPLVMASIRTHGVRSAVYSDRYLLTPLNLRLFSEVIGRIPGGKINDLNITTARAPRIDQFGWTVFHTFPEDGVRRAVIQELFPNARIDIREKVQLPHERSLQLFLSDDRKITIMFDQGFGGWRASGTPRHNFAAEPSRQARSLKSLDFPVEVEEGRDTPVVLEVS